ncbi:DOC domain-containing protein [Entamoeba marina]
MVDVDWLKREDVTEIGKDAMIYVSSSRIGFGVENLRDGNTHTFWQSNGERPHMITFLFDEVIELAFVRVFISQPIDDSYTPSKLLLRIGNSLYDMVDRVLLELNQPNGWCYLKTDAEMKGSCVQVQITENCSDGRDSHLRQIEVYSHCNQTPFTDESLAFSYS